MVRKIHFNHHQINLRESGEFRLIKNFALQTLAPATPIGASEIKEHNFVFEPGLVQGRMNIAEPFHFRPLDSQSGGNCSQENEPFFRLFLT